MFTEWARLAQGRVGWHKLVTMPLFAIGKPFVRQPQGDTRVTPEDRRRAVAQRAAAGRWRSAQPGSPDGGRSSTPTTATEDTRYDTGTLAHADPNWTLELTIRPRVVHGAE